MKYRRVPIIRAVRRDITPEGAAEICAIAVRWARRREELLDRMRAAFADGDEERVRELARELCGLEEKRAA
jgi:hypothetical protein